MNKRVSEKDIKRVVREWMERMRKAYETGYSITTDKDIECPQCGGYCDISFYPGRGWRNRNSDCAFKFFPADLIPPSPREFEDYLRHKELRKKIELFLNFKQEG